MIDFFVLLWEATFVYWFVVFVNCGVLGSDGYGFGVVGEVIYLSFEFVYRDIVEGVHEGQELALSKTNGSI